MLEMMDNSDQKTTVRISSRSHRQLRALVAEIGKLQIGTPELGETVEVLIELADPSAVLAELERTRAN